jgi:hypothetical protein
VWAITNPTVPKLSQNDGLSQNFRRNDSKNYWDSEHSPNTGRALSDEKTNEKQVLDAARPSKKRGDASTVKPDCGDIEAVRL